MMNASEIRSLTSLSKDERQAVAGAFRALAQCRDEVVAANERFLAKAVEQMAAAQQASGWPEHAIAAAREHIVKAAKVQTDMIDQIMEAWERQLKSGRKPSGVPTAPMLRMPPFSQRVFVDPMSDMMRMGEMALVPFKLWIRAAEAWQRNWANTISARAEPQRPRPARKRREPAKRTR